MTSKKSLDEHRSEQERRLNERYHDRMIDYVKHLTTLSTGSIVLQVAFLEKVFPQPKWRALIVISLVAFGISVIGSVVAYTLLLDERADAPSPPEPVNTIFRLFLLTIWVGFLTGITALGTFGIRNVIGP